MKKSFTGITNVMKPKRSRWFEQMKQYILYTFFNCDTDYLKKRKEVKLVKG